MGAGRAAAEQHPVGVFHHRPLQQVAIADVTGVEITVVVLLQQVDRLAHQVAVQWVAAEVSEDDGERPREERVASRLGAEPLARVDQHRQAHVVELVERFLVGEAVRERVELEPVEPVVVRVLFDVLGRGVVVLPPGGEVAEPRSGSVAGVARPVYPREREERSVDAPARDRVVRAHVAPAVALAGEHHRPHHARLMHLAFEPVRADGSPPRLDAPGVGVEPGVDVHHSEPVFQFQHWQTDTNVSYFPVSVSAGGAGRGSPSRGKFI